MEIALKVNDADNVATIFTENIAAGTEVEVHDKKGNRSKLMLKDSIPYGHKVALRDITAGEHIIKYGEVIGQATQAIQMGSHVHVQNLDSLRARGDLQNNG